MNHPTQRDPFYPGCFRDLGIIVLIIAIIGYFVL